MTPGWNGCCSTPRTSPRTDRVGVPYEVSVDHEARAIIVKGHGRGSLAEALDLIAHHIPLIHSHPRYNILYDARELDVDATPSDVMQLASALFQFRGHAYGRIALVVPPKRESLA